MAKFTVTSPDGATYEVNAPAGATEQDAIAYVQKNFAAEKPAPPLGQQLNRLISDIPRQVGLTARYGLEGVGSVPQILGSAMESMGVPGAGRNMGGALADAVGLPNPQTSQERIVGDASRMMASAALPIGLASKGASMVSGAAKPVLEAVAANPVSQMSSAASAGAAGGYTRETGGNDVSQLLASVAGGVAAPMAIGAGQGMAKAATNAVNNLRNPQAQNINIDVIVNNALKSSGMTMDALPQNIQAGIREDVANAFKIGGENLSPDAIRRLADYRLTGATPTRGGLTLDPAIVSQQKNLAKQGINSKDVVAQQLGQTENANNQQLIAGLNNLGANTADDAIAGGKKIIGALDAKNDAAKGIIKQFYDTAKATGGRSAALDPNAFATKADELLTQSLRNGELPGDIRKALNGFASGEVPLTVDTAEQFKTAMAKVQRLSNDGGVREAISHVRSALDDTPLLPGQGLGQEAIDAFNKARQVNRTWMGIVEKTPALQAVRDGVEPDKFVQQFIVGNGTNANTMDLAMLKKAVKSNPEALTAIKEQITAHLKGKALNGAEDEVGSFSQSAYNKALKAIGERKLEMFFSPEEVNQLKAIGRVASYEQFQPRGSAVNNSNTAGTAISALLDRIGNSSLLSKIPLGSSLATPINNIAIGMKATQSLNVPGALIGGPQIRQPSTPQGLLMSPAIFAPQNKEENRGLLSLP